MPIQLDKILADIAQEKVLHPHYPPAGKKEIDEAWARVGKNNKLSVHEARSIFKVLQKKYDQEKTKRTPSWKLFQLMQQIHEPMKEEPKRDDDGMVSMEEDEEYEMLEVQEEEEPTPAQAKTESATSDGESPTKSMKSAGSTESTPEKEEKPLIKTQLKAMSGVATAASSASSKSLSPAAEEKKVLNSLASTRANTTPAVNAATPTTAASSNAINAAAAASNAATAAAAAALHKKGITMKKTSTTASTGIGTPTSSTPRTGQATSFSNAQQKNNTSIRLNVGETIPLPESIKRKLVETQPAGPQPAKKANTGSASSPVQSTASTAAGSGTATAVRNTANTTTPSQESAQTSKNSSSMNIKQESNESAGINLITIPGNSRVELTNGGVGGGGRSSSTAATVASTSTNGYSPRLEEIDFRNDIIFDAGNGPINGPVAGVVNHPNHANAPGGIINLGNFDNSLPPTFFKNLCNSSRHEALGLYVANVMNRLRARSAAKLELGILRAIIDVQSDELEN